MKIQSILLKTVLILFPLAATLLLIQFLAIAGANYIYSQTTGQISFLAPLTVHKNTTTQISQIEYSVLRVPAAKTTGVVK